LSQLQLRNIIFKIGQNLTEWSQK